MSQAQYVSNNNESLIIKPPPDLAVAYLAKFTKSLSFQVYISKVESSHRLQEMRTQSKK